LEQIETIKKRIESSEDLQTVVKNMKSLAAVYIRFFQQASRAVNNYRQTVARGFQAFFSSDELAGYFPSPAEAAAEEKSRGAGPAGGPGLGGVSEPGVGSFSADTVYGDNPGIIIIGSEQGMCGNFNEKLIEFLQRFTETVHTGDSPPRLLAAGTRIHQPAGEAPYPVDQFFRLPNSPEQIAELVDETLIYLDSWRRRNGLSSVYTIHNSRGGEQIYETRATRIFPMDRKFLNKQQREEWPGRTVPLLTLPKRTVFQMLLNQYYYTELFRAFIESMESENAARLASMEAAEKNIQEKLAELHNLYNIRRQQAITSELLDMVSGFEALSD
jgi:F-type H+-transporting ATPase subunit gamma